MKGIKQLQLDSNLSPNILRLRYVIVHNVQYIVLEVHVGWGANNK